MQTRFELCLSFLRKLLSIKDEKVIISEQEINEKIETLNNMIESGFAKTLIDPSVDIPLTEEEKTRLKRTIETQVNIHMDQCTVLNGEKQKKRNCIWWTNIKNNMEKIHWNNYEDSLSFSPNVIRTLDQDTDIVLNNLFNPKSITSETRYGMVIGHVQSGKTSNYAGLICKAADAGYQCFIVIAGIHNNLRNQTQTRLKAVFKNAPLDKEPIFLTTDELDFNKKGAQRYATLSFENHKSPIFMVIKKNSHTLKNILSWLNKKYPQQCKASLLLIDDEADNASINTKEDEDPTVINKYIRKILAKFQKHAYIGYTATPFANIFINDEATDDELGKDLFPDDFLVTLDAPANYFGAEKYFLEENECIKEINDFKLPKGEIKDLPLSLKEAIQCFFLNVAIRSLRGQGHKDSSMLVHISRLTEMHQTMARYIEKYVENIIRHIDQNGRLKSALTDEVIAQFKELYESQYATEFEWNRVLDELNIIYNKIRVAEIHSKSKDIISFCQTEPQYLILVGGNSLSRGFTLEGLNVSYFTRPTCAADTLMQMARWFGYRPGYEDICRIYLTEKIRDNFESVTESTLDLFQQIEEMRLQQKTPKDFGLAVKRNPGAFLITARNKMKHTQDLTIEVCLDGHSKETSWFSTKKEEHNANLEAFRYFLKNLGSFSNDFYEGKYLFECVDSEKISYFVNDKKHGFIFLEDYEHLPISTIKEYLQKYPDIKWNVVVDGVSKNEQITLREDIQIGVKERRMLNRADDIGFYEINRRQLTQGMAEKFCVSKSAFEKIEAEFKTEGKILSRSEIRNKIPRPTLMLHLVKWKDEADFSDWIFPAVSFVFPRSPEERTRTIVITANTVYLRKMAEQIEFDFGDDFDE